MYRIVQILMTLEEQVRNQGLVIVNATNLDLTSHHGDENFV